jgi:hypothetical protein
MGSNVAMPGVGFLLVLLPFGCGLFDSAGSEKSAAVPTNGGSGGQSAGGGSGGTVGGGATNGGGAGGIGGATSCAGLPGPRMIEVSSPGGTKYCVDRTEVTEGCLPRGSSRQHRSIGDRSRKRSTSRPIRPGPISIYWSRSGSPNCRGGRGGDLRDARPDRDARASRSDVLVLEPTKAPG